MSDHTDTDQKGNETTRARDLNHPCLEILGLAEAARGAIGEFIAGHEWNADTVDAEDLGRDMTPLLATLSSVNAILSAARDGLARDGLDDEGYVTRTES